MTTLEMQFQAKSAKMLNFTFLLDIFLKLTWCLELRQLQWLCLKKANTMVTAPAGRCWNNSSGIQERGR